MTQFASPVLHSLLDTDAYKLHMQQAVFHHYYDVHVAAEFRCRGDDLLGIYADAIREQVQAMQHLRLQDDEYQWLSALPFFKADYLNWLREFRFNPEQVTVSNDNGKLDIRLSGPWREVILFGGLFRLFGWSGFMAFIISLLFAYTVKYAFIDSWILVKMMSSYIRGKGNIFIP